MKKVRNYQLTIDLLKEISKAALQNSEELCEEAALLEANGHFARAYFLAVAAIEEMGKAQIAFDAQGRKLNDSAVADKIKKSFEDHSAKITAAFIPWMDSSTDRRSAYIKGVDLMVQLKMAREPSMYTDVRNEGEHIHIPSKAVRPIAAKDSVRLARTCLIHSKAKLNGTNNPVKHTPAQNALFALKPTIYSPIVNSQDFWWYYLSRMEAGDSAFENAVLEYQKEFVGKSRLFKAETEGASL